MSFILDKNNRYRNMFGDITEDMVNESLTVLSEADMEQFLKKCSLIYDSYGGSPGWCITIKKLNVIE